MNQIARDNSAPANTSPNAEGTGVKRHCLGRGILGNWPYVDIPAQEFEDLKQAKRNIFVLLGIEEKFDMVVDNFLEYERDLLDLALVHMAGHDVTWSSGHDAIGLMNRRVANCLSAARLYIDQVKHDLSKVYGKDSHISTQMKETLSAQYDRLLGYRAMEAIRNFVQHRSLPVARVEYPSALENRPRGRKLLHHRVNAVLDPEQLREDKEIKRAVVDELVHAGQESLSITLLLREYIEGLSRAQEHLRSLVKDDIGPWKRSLLDIIDRYSDACGERVNVVIAYELDDDKTLDEFQIFGDGIERLEALRAKRLPTNVSLWFVSNEPM